MMNAAQCNMLLKELGACEDAREWACGKSLSSVWSECNRGDWLLWLAAKLGVERKLIVLAACDCAETALKHVPAGEDRPRLAIETAREWCRGKATIEEVRAAADARVSSSASCASAYAASFSAYAAAYAAAADDGVASWAACASGYAACASAYAASFAAADAAARAAHADLVRARISYSDVLDAAKQHGGSE